MTEYILRTEYIQSNAALQPEYADTDSVDAEVFPPGSDTAVDHVSQQMLY